MSNLAVRVEDIGKQYNIFQETARYITLREKIVETLKTPVKTLLNPTGSEKFWALRHVDFTLDHGRCGGHRQERLGKSPCLSCGFEPTGLARSTSGGLLEVGGSPELTTALYFSTAPSWYEEVKWENSTVVRFFKIEFITRR